MLPFFPTPYPDELFYSICARFHELSPNLRVGWTMEQLFGRKQVAISFHLPRYLNKLNQNLLSDSLLNTDFFIEQSTLLPFYKPFLPGNRVDKIICHMKSQGEKNGGIRITAGITGNNIPTLNRLRFCPVCIRDDEEKFGEPYWHRSHQIIGVDVCHIHNVTLLESSVQDGIANNLITLWQELQSYKGIFVKENRNMRLNAISKEVYYILNHSIPDLGLIQIRNKYIKRLQYLHLATISGKIKHKEFLLKFERFYGESLLEQFGICKTKDTKSYWLTKILENNPRTVHPIYHVLLIKFLDLTIHDFFFGDEKGYEPFGQGPWLCLNPAAEHYQQAVINEVDVYIQFNIKLPVGIFYCSCGYIYTRKGPDKNEEDKYRKTSVKNYGELWERTLLKLLNEEKKSIRLVAKMLGVDPKTIKSQLNRLEKRKETSFVEKQKSYRALWLTCVEQNPSLNRTELKTLLKCESKWLYRYDKAWFLANSPSKQVNPNIKSMRRTRYVDWEKRDKELVKLVLVAAKEIKNTQGKPVRLTKALIGRKAGGCGMWVLQKRLDKLPKTKNIVNSLIESHEEYQIRRVKWAARILFEEGVLLTKNTIIKKAGLLGGYSGQVSEAINNEIEKYLLQSNKELH
ncbi:TPA: TnsD family transposase [Bacillus paranthracis]